MHTSVKLTLAIKIWIFRHINYKNAQTTDDVCVGKEWSDIIHIIYYLVLFLDLSSIAVVLKQIIARFECGTLSRALLLSRKWMSAEGVKVPAAEMGVLRTTARVSRVQRELKSFFASFRAVDTRIHVYNAYYVTISYSFALVKNNNI